MNNDVHVIHGYCEDVLPTLASETFDVVLTDPPYPEIDRSYGRMSEAVWFKMMRAVVPECMRVLKPTGSAVFILMPNSEKVGRMRTWLWEFMAWVGKEWGIVQDVWWWNTAAIPQAHAIGGRLMRPSLKACVWIGPPDCYRSQDAILWRESETNAKKRAEGRFAGKNGSGVDHRPSGHRRDLKKSVSACVERGGVTPFNVLPFANTSSQDKYGHGAMTPVSLIDWWIKYLCPPGGSVLDPFVGSGTTCLSVLKRELTGVGIEKEMTYYETAKRRVARLKMLLGPLPETVKLSRGRTL